MLLAVNISLFIIFTYISLNHTDATIGVLHFMGLDLKNHQWSLSFPNIEATDIDDSVNRTSHKHEGQ